MEERKNNLRPEINQKILAAKELGDLSENAEYSEAKELQAFNEGRIVELEDIVKNAIIVGPQQQHSVVMVGSTVKVTSKHGDQKFTIVGASESNPSEGFISNESPLGSAFLNHKKGEEVEVKTPSGMVIYTIQVIA